MTITSSTTKKFEAVRLVLNGRVQGIGLRPAIARFAAKLGLGGHVCNTSDGVKIHVEGSLDDVKSFQDNLLSNLPNAAIVELLRTEMVEPIGVGRFSILEHLHTRNDVSASECASLATWIPADLAVCERCLNEVRDSNNRRFGYAFTSCTDCGPRYSIIETMPYERSETCMNQFPMCAECRCEFESPADRRFHSQTNACPDCGPRLWLTDKRGCLLGNANEAVCGAAQALFAGQIIAIRGLGGYQLLTDATSQTAVEKLRQRKRRRGKPLAVMVANLTAADEIALLDDIGRRTLVDPSNPIVVVQSRTNSKLADSIFGGLNTVGVLLPTTPLHWLLLKEFGRPLVCTSGNLDGEPIEFCANDAVDRLADVADLFLEHDRPIRRPIDDSVVRIMAGRPVTLRLARGMAPLSLNILACDDSILAVGGHQKCAVALSTGQQSVLGPHVGDLDSVSMRRRYADQTGELRLLYGTTENSAVADQHPEYHSRRVAEESAANLIEVQHHHAHVVAGMIEHNWLDRKVLGVAFDGTGLGTDDSIWGGEFLVSTVKEFERIGHLRPFRLPGGEQAIREPWRIATTLVCDALGQQSACSLEFQTKNPSDLLPILNRPQFSPGTTSAGRLFDGIASLVLGIEQVQFEGQAAMMLESACELDSEGAYCFDFRSDGVTELDWRPVIYSILQDRQLGVSTGTLAMRFHRGLADAITFFCGRLAELPVVLGGGVFQNKILIELLQASFERTGQTLGTPGIIPPNDGGLAAGQLAIGAAITRQQRNTICV